MKKKSMILMTKMIHMALIFFKKINYNFKTCPINLNYKYDICKESYEKFEVFVSYKDNKEYIAIMITILIYIFMYLFING